MARSIISLLLALAVVTMAANSAVARQFKKPAYYKLSNEPYGVVSTDFNNDGNLDLAVAEFSGQVGILLGKGKGTFHPARYFSAPGAIALAYGDFNGDHNLDLAVIEYGGTGYSALGIFLGDGQGNFRSSATYQLGVESTSVAVANFNGDGHLDIAATNEHGSGKNGKDGSVMVFFGNGDGTFKAPSLYKLPGQPYAVAVGDFKGNHHPDLAVAEDAGNSVAILMNNGSGKFRHTATYHTDIEAICVAIADLDHNGVQDLVVGDAIGNVAVLLGSGDGTFGRATLYSTSPTGTTEAVVIADFNLDGNPDIAVAVSGGQDGGVVLLYGNGDGTFQSLVHIGISKGDGLSLAAGDFNKDGAPDLAVPIDGSEVMAILLNTQ